MSEKSPAAGPQEHPLLQEDAGASFLRTLFLGTALSRLSGLFRDLVTAFLLGTGADAFLTAFRVPHLLRRLVAEGSLGTAHTVLFIRRLRADGRAAALRFFRNAQTAGLVAGILLVAVLVSGGSLLLLMGLAPGFAGNPDLLAVADGYLRLCLPYLPLCLACALAYSTAACLGDFVPQAYGGAALNAGVLMGAGVALLARVPAHTSALFLCAGLLAGGIFQTLLVFLRHPELRPALRDFAPKGLWAAFTDRRVAALARSTPAATAAASPHLAFSMAALAAASFLAPGSVSALYFAERIYELPLGLAGVALGLEALPRLSRAAAAGEKASFCRAAEAGLGMAAFLSLPAAAGLAALAEPLARLFYVRGAFSPEDGMLTAKILCAFAPGLPAMCAARQCIAALQALEKNRAALASLCAGLLCFAVVAACGAPYLESAAIGWGLSAGAWAHTGLLLVLLHRNGLFPLVPRTLARVAGYALSACLLGYAVRLYGPQSREFWPLLGGVIGCAAGGALAWIAFFRLLGTREAVELTRLIRLRKVRTGGP